MKTRYLFGKGKYHALTVNEDGTITGDKDALDALTKLILPHVQSITITTAEGETTVTNE